MFTSLGTTSNKAETMRRALQPMVLEEDKRKLTATPSAQEIRDALFSIHADKALGPDGFSVGFYQIHWQKIGSNIVKEVHNLFEMDIIPENINETHIRLIPKMKSPQRVAEYRPIAL